MNWDGGKEALVNLDESLVISQRFVGDGENAGYARARAITVMDRAGTLSYLNRHAEALNGFRESLRQLQALNARRDDEFAADVALARDNVDEALIRLAESREENPPIDNGAGRA